MFEDQINRALGIFEHRNNVRDHYYCVKEMFELYNSVEQLEKIAAREDIDTICAHDYVKMKKYALEGEGLKIQDYKPELRGIDKVPVFTPEMMGQKLPNFQ